MLLHLQYVQKPSMADNVLPLELKLSETKLAIALYLKCYDHPFQTLWFSSLAGCYCVGGGESHCASMLFINLPILSSIAVINDLDKALRKFIWQNQKARVKAKYLQDKKENGGFALPNLVIYYQTSALMWIKHWCLLLNYNNLKLEGHGLFSGCHHYLWLEGKIPHSFTICFLRKTLINTWLILRPMLYLQIPSRVSPLEAVLYVRNINEKPLDYSKLL